MNEIESKILNVIYRVIDDINDQEDQTQAITKSLDTILMGSGSDLDSLGIVNFIVAVEQNIDDDFDVTITLADERALSQEVSPFRTVRSLSDYITVLINEEVNE